MTPTLITDAEELVVNYLRELPSVAAIVSERVYTAWPAQQEGTPPTLIVQRIGGLPPFSIPLVLDEAVLQVDAYGGPKKTAHNLVATVRAELTLLPGLVRPEGVASGVSFGPMRYLPDEAFPKARPRYIADVTVHVRAVPPASTAERSSRLAEEAMA